MELYAFVADQEHSAEITEVADFSLDEMHLQHPHSHPLPGATLTVHEWKTIQP